MGFALQEVEKYGCKIVTVEPAQRRIEGVIKSGAVVQVAVYTVDPFFRWPVVGENWMIRRENGTWYLDSKWQNQEGEAEFNTTIINNLNEGDALIDAPTEKVYLTSGNLLATQPWVQTWTTAKIEELIAGAKPPLLSTLPSSPKDGEVIYFQNAAMESQGVVWNLRYRAGSASAFKWEFVGGPRMLSGTSGAIETTSSTYVELTSGPTLVAPITGEYDVSLSILTHASEAAAQNLESAIGTSPASLTEFIVFISVGTFNGAWMENSLRVQLTGGSTYKVFVKTNGGMIKGAWSGAHIGFSPVRI